MTSHEPTIRTGTPLRVLVVEDRPDARNSQAALLRLWGYEARVAADGLAALEAAGEFLPDAVLLDLGLPGLNGFEVARRLRRDPRLAGVLILAVSGWGRPEDVRRAMEAGCDHHLTKPCDLATLGALLDARRSRGVDAAK